MECSDDVFGDRVFELGQDQIRGDTPLVEEETCKSHVPFCGFSRVREWFEEGCEQGL